MIQMNELPNVATYSIGCNDARPDKYIAKYSGRIITSPIYADRQVTILCCSASGAESVAQEIATERAWALLSVRQE